VDGGENDAALHAFNVKAAIRRLQSFRCSDGSLSYWPGTAGSSPFGSAYALHFLQEAENAGYAVPADLKNTLSAYVTGMVRDNVLEVFPFVMGVDRYTLAASGLQHLDESFNYHLSAIKSPLLVKFGLNIWGDDFDKVNYGLARAKYRNVRVPDFSRQLDTVQNSLLASIHNVFELGVEKVIAENNAQHYIQDRMEETGYTPAADTLAAPASVTDSLAIMSRRFEQAAEEMDREALKEEVLEAISGEALKSEQPAISSEDPPVFTSEGTTVISSEAEKSES
jgi:hypothetical protein